MAGERVKVDTTPDIFQKIVELTFAKEFDKRATKIRCRLDSGQEFELEVPFDISPYQMREQIENKTKEQHGYRSKGQEGPPS